MSQFVKLKKAHRCYPHAGKTIYQVWKEIFGLKFHQVEVVHWDGVHPNKGVPFIQIGLSISKPPLGELEVGGETFDLIEERN